MKKAKKKYLCSSGPFNVLYYPWKLSEAKKKKKTFCSQFLGAPLFVRWHGKFPRPLQTKRPFHSNSFVMRKLLEGIRNYLKFISWGFSYSHAMASRLCQHSFVQTSVPSMNINKLSNTHISKQTLKLFSETFKFSIFRNCLKYLW